MGHQQVYLAADAGKHLGDNTKWANGSFAVVKGLIFGAIALVVASVFAFFGSLLLLKITDMISPLRVSAEEEEVGLDISQHGERL